MSTLSFAYYRLPYADSYTLISSRRPPVVIDCLESLGKASGFVVVPFHSSDSAPALLIQPDSITTCKILPSVEESKRSELVIDSIDNQAVTDEYRNAFEEFHSAVDRGDFRKLVLSRNKTICLSIDVDLTDPFSMRSLYEKACRLYPRLMVILFSTSQSGTWLIASPEILMDGERGSLHTVALAGTMPFQEGYMTWSEKNKHEQHIVEQYIEGIISEVSNDMLKDGPVTMRAGDLVHLRTDFRFHLSDGVSFGTLVNRLHPTPAVCGMPKQKAADFIAAVEGIDRRYYSGFVGPVDINGQTHLYVSLRCAQLSKDEGGIKATLYAGGGIMPDSNCQSEFLETESKMKTIEHVLQ